MTVAMNLYHISAPTRGYDVFSDAVVAAIDEDDARRIHPGADGESPWYDDWPNTDSWVSSGSWVKTPSEVDAELIGTAVPSTGRGVICASFHAG